MASMEYVKIKSNINAVHDIHVVFVFVLQKYCDTNNTQNLQSQWFSPNSIYFC